MAGPAPLRIWVIYDHPADFPGCFVARLFEGEQPTEQVMVSADLEPIRTLLSAELGLVLIPRDDSDDPTIVESWL